MTFNPDEWVATQKTRFHRGRLFSRHLAFPTIIPLFWTIAVQGLEHFPKEGPVIVMMNHITAIDPAWVVASVPHRDIIPMSKAENINHPFYGLLARIWGAYPVERGAVDRKALRTAIGLMEQGEATLIAPEGTRAPALQKAKDGLAYVASKTGAAVVPAAVFNAEGWSDDMRIPWRRTPVHVSFGPAFKLRVPNGQSRVPRQTMAHMSDEMMYQLAAQLPERNRGYYADLTQTTTDTLEFLN